MTPYWVSWWEPAEHFSKFEYHGPWWISGSRDCSSGGEELSVCAAVMASSDDGAKSVIITAHDDPSLLDWDNAWRFAKECDPEWVPFTSRFARAAWMQWPWPSLELKEQAESEKEKQP